jgi:hypothetical protein
MRLSVHPVVTRRMAFASPISAQVRGPPLPKAHGGAALRASHRTAQAKPARARARVFLFIRSKFRVSMIEAGRRHLS